jgi:hypothetical protein
MESVWLKCTALSGDFDTYVNFGNAVSFSGIDKPHPHKGKGTRVRFSFTHEDHVDIGEAPEDVARLLKDVRNARGPEGEKRRADAPSWSRRLGRAGLNDASLDDGKDPAAWAEGRQSAQKQA